MRLFRRILPQLETALSEHPSHVFTFEELRTLLGVLRHELGVSGIGANRLVELFAHEKKASLRRVVLENPEYPSVTRYIWKEASAFEIALSIRRASYLTHATAMYLHGLAPPTDRTIYVNSEQSAKPEPTGNLTQEGIDRAFRNQQRHSRYVLEHDGWRYVVVNGKATGGLGVAQIAGAGQEKLAVTGLERTLIDIVVRPSYSGGVFKVQEAFARARPRASIDVLVTTLTKLRYVYPYHQAIGFYMERGGYDARALQVLRRFGTSFDFYLAHGMEQTQYSKDWRLFYPKGL